MSKTLAMIRQRLNNHNPATQRILPEILIMIASNLKTNADLITKATHVCHHWRVILLSCPNLWTHLNFARENQALSFLHRSEPFPIHVDLTSITPSQSLIDLLCQHSARVNTLRVGRFDVDGLQKLFRLPLASLRTLEVATPNEWFQVLAVRSVAREFLTLTSLTLGRNPGALAFRGSRITHLRVTIPGVGSLEVAELLSLFRSCVHLERLEVENQIGLESDSLLPPDGTIPLTRLRSFTQTLHCSRHVAGILYHLKLPPSCSIVLRCIAGHTNGYLPLSFPNLRNTPYFTNIKRVKVVYAAGFLGRNAGITWDIVNDKGTRFTGTMGFFNHAISLSAGEHTGGGETKLSVPAVEVLCVDGHRYVSLENYGCLTTLILSGPVVHRYLGFLAGISYFRDRCKNLHTLVLFVAPTLFTPSLVKYLFDIAQTWAKAGTSLKAIAFAYPSAPPRDDLKILEGLKAYVERVELLLGDDALDWNPDKYFLNGL